MIYLSKLAKRLALAGPHAGLILCVLAFAGACASPEEREFLSPNPSQPVPITSLTVEPKIGTAKPGEVIQFNATVKNAKGAAVVADVDWSATGGTISATGTFVSDVFGQFQVTARLRSNGLIADSAKVGVFVNPKDVLKLSVTPEGTEVTEGEGVQLEATAELADGSVVLQPALSWSADVGQVDGSGYFIAPETEGTYLVAARAASGVTASASVLVKPNRRNLERVEVAPGSATLGTGQTQQFTAVGIWEDGYTKTIPTAWSSTGGTISGEGLFTAGSAAGNFRVIGRFKQGTQADTAFISITEPQIVGLDVAPGNTALAVGATQQYTASARMSDGTSKAVGATWEATGGSINASGLYSATNSGSWVVKAKVAGTSVAGEAQVSVSAPVATLTAITLNPSSATIPAGTSRQFSVTGSYSDGSVQTPSVTWSATGGNITASGNYTAGAALGTFHVIASASGKADTSVISVSQAELTSLSISPATVSLPPGATQQFTASGTWSNGSTTAPTLTWMAEGGTVTTTGNFTAGSASGTYRVIGTHSAGRADTSLVTIAPPPPTLVSLSLNPSSVSLTPSGTRQFSVSGSWTNGGSEVPSVTYTATGGTITAGGLYSAGSTSGTFRVIAKHTDGPLADTSSVVISPLAPTLQSITISPATTSLQTGGSRQFTVTAAWSDGSSAAPGVTWSASSGTISSSGLYLAPSSAGTYKVIVRETAGTIADTATVTVTAPAVVTDLTVTPGSKSLPTGGTQQFTASATYSNGGTGTPSLVWSATGGTINSGGLYTASSSSGNYRVIAQASGTSVKDTATVTLTSSTPTVTRVVLSPGSATLNPGGTAQFSVAPTWSDGATRAITPTYSATGGTVTSAGLFTAGSTVGTFLVIASCTGCNVSDTSAITIQTSSGSGVSSLSISPSTITLDIGEVYQFTASAILTNGATQSNPTVTWAAVGAGLVSSVGLYRAPSSAGTYTVRITHSGGAVANATVTVVVPTSPYFSDSFDNCGAINKTANAKGFRWSDTGGGTTGEKPAISSEISLSGSCSLRFRFEGGAAGDDSWSEQRFAFGKKLSEVYLQWYQYFPTGAESPSVGPKFSHRNDTGPDNNKLLRLWDDIYTDSYVKTGYSMLPSSTAGDNHLNPEVTVRGSDEVIRSVTNIGPWPSIVNASRRGHWVKFVVRTKLATGPDSADGIMQMWIDGVQVVNHTTLNTYSGAINPKNWIRNGYIVGWANSGFAVTTNTYIDDFVISATPIP